MIKSILKIIAFTFGALILIGVAFGGDEETNGNSGADQNSSTSPSQSQPAETESNESIKTLAGLKSAISAELGSETNMGVPRNLEVTMYKRDLYVVFALNENFTNDMMIGRAWTETSMIIELSQESGLSKNLTVNGTLELFDTNGNSLDQRAVFTANFLNDNLPLLNTNNLIGREMWERAATSYFYHPAIQG
jgi:hypothetical protein